MMLDSFTNGPETLVSVASITMASFQSRVFAKHSVAKSNKRSPAHFFMGSPLRSIMPFSPLSASGQFSSRKPSGDGGAAGMILPGLASLFGKGIHEENWATV